MALFTRYELRAKAQGMTVGLRKSAATVLNEAYREFSEFKTYDIFMSHSVLNAEEILALKNEIERMGFSVYVDWIEDPQLNRSSVTKNTAELLRTRMNCCKSLFFATSETSPNSKWMPWELGYFDGKKDKSAILPVLEDIWSSNQYKGQEYLGLYPYITKDTEQNTGKETLWVHEDEYTYISFKSWLEGYKPRSWR